MSSFIDFTLNENVLLQRPFVIVTIIIALIVLVFFGWLSFFNPRKKKQEDGE